MKATLLFVILSLGVSAAIAEPIKKRFSFSNFCFRVSARITGNQPEVFQLTPEVRTELRNIQNRVRKLEDDVRKLNNTEVPKTLKLRGEEVEVVRMLGDGLYGAVYLVKDKSGQLYSVKQYKTEASLRGDFELMERLRAQSNYQVAKIYDSDVGEKWLKLEYIDGVAPMTIWSSDPLDSTVRTQISVEVEKLGKEKERWGNSKVFLHGKNVILEIETGRLVIIDPR